MASACCSNRKVVWARAFKSLSVRGSRVPWKSLVRMFVKSLMPATKRSALEVTGHLEVWGWEPGYGVSDSSGFGVPDPDIVAVVVVQCWA